LKRTALFKFARAEGSAAGLAGARREARKE